MQGNGRYDSPHGDEPEIEAARLARRRDIEDYRADHWEEYEEDGDE